MALALVLPPHDPALVQSLINLPALLSIPGHQSPAFLEGSLHSMFKGSEGQEVTGSI